MTQLIEIKTVPIEIEMKVSSAKLEYTRGAADLEISRDKGGLNIKSRPIHLNMDTFEMSNSIAPSPTQSIAQYAQKGRQATYRTNAVYAQQGELLLKAKIGEDVLTQYSKNALGPDRSALSPDRNARQGLTFLPSAGQEINQDAGELNIKFEMDKLNFEWRISANKFKFTPGDIEISVKQQPDVIIKYVGDPLYVPPSANPNYEPVDVNA